MLQQTILLGSIFLHLISGEICDQHAWDKMTTQFRDCAAELSYEFQDTKNTFPGEVYVQEAACLLFNKTVKQCGKPWRKCHSEEEVQHIEDMHLESLLGQYKDIQLDHCQIVVEYMQSDRRNTIIHHEEKCDDELTTKANDKFQNCSSNSSTEAHGKIIEVENAEVVTKILCDTFEIIKNVCKAHLASCFSEEDIETMNENNVKQMRPFLIQLTRGKVDDGGLDDCDTNDNQLIIAEHEIVHTTTVTHTHTSAEPFTAETSTIPPQNSKKSILAPSADPIQANQSPGDRNAKQSIHIENIIAPSADPVHANQSPEKPIENNEEQKEAKEMKHAKTTVFPPKAAYKKDNESSANNKNVSSIIFSFIIFILLK